MIKWVLYSISWISCVLFTLLILGQPEKLGIQLRVWGVPGSVIDVFLANRGVQIVAALSVVLLLGYAVPLIVTRLLDMRRLARTNANIIAARHEQRSLGAIEDLVHNDAALAVYLSPVAQWAHEHIGANGETHVAVHMRPSDLLSAKQLAGTDSFFAVNHFMPKLLVAVVTVICLLMLSHSSDRAFAEILSVSGTDYGTMLLGLRSATAAMAIAVFAAMLVWAIQTLFDTKMLRASQTIVRSLDKLVAHDDGDTAQLTAPRPFVGSLDNQGALVEQLLSQIGHKVDDAADRKMKKAALETDEKYLSLLAALQQSMAELQSLRADVDGMSGNNLYQMPATSDDRSVGKLTSAIRALKDATASELPQL
jgi:hypothetical protein